MIPTKNDAFLPATFFRATHAVDEMRVVLFSQHDAVGTRPHHDDYWPGADYFVVSDAPYRTLFYPEGWECESSADRALPE